MTQPTLPIKNKSDFGTYWGDSLLNVDEERNLPIIEKLLWERDVIFLIGKEKVGKSIFVLQLASSISSGEDFLDTFKILHSLPIWYIQAEGKRLATVKNLKSMMKVVSLNPDNFFHTYAPAIKLNTPQGYNKLLSLLNVLPATPRVIFIDPLYKTVKGSLKDEEVAVNWTDNIALLADRCNATIFVTHHVHRSYRLDDGSFAEEGDDAIFGSFIWKAFCDHVFLLRRHKDRGLTLSCDTQRSAEVEERLDLQLVQPSPLYFELKGTKTPCEELVKYHITQSDKGLCSEELVNLIKLSRASIMNALRSLYSKQEITKDLSGKRPVLYSVNKTQVPLSPVLPSSSV